MKITLLTGKTFDIREAVGFDLKVIKSSAARKLTLRIDSKARIPVLTIPKHCTKKQAVEFAQSQAVWVKTNLSSIPPIKKFADNETFSLFGKEVKILHDSKLKSGCLIKENILYVSGEEEFIHRRVKDFIKKEAKKRFLETSREKAGKIDCKVNAVFIKDTKTRWGSCSSDNNINYSWRLALAPDFVIDYLISHEVAHLLHPDHSQAFWDCVKNLCPQTAQGNAWLKANGKDLYLYE